MKRYKYKRVTSMVIEAGYNRRTTKNKCPLPNLLLMNAVEIKTAK